MSITNVSPRPIEFVTPYPDINALLAEFVAGAKSILGKNLVGLYLTGSLAYGDFVPERSDIDLQAVVLNPLTEEELRAVEELHRTIDRHSPRWAKRTECSYVPRGLMEEPSPPRNPRPWWGFDSLYPAAPAGNEWIINHYFLAKFGIALEGPNFSTLIQPIDIREVQKASARDLFKEWEPKIADLAWLSNSHYQSYLVLNLCRILHTVIGGEPGSKRIAAQWTKQKYPEWKELIEKAERWGYGDEMKKNEQAIAFIKFVIARVNETGLTA
jgi:hypothetical protein